MCTSRRARAGDLNAVRVPDGVDEARLAQGLAACYRDLGRAAAESPTGEDALAQRYVAAALGALGHPDAIPALREGARSGASESRLFAIVALGRLGATEAVADLVDFARDPDGDVRKAAVYVLGQLAATDDAAATAALREALGDRQADVTWNAALALAGRGDPAGAPLVGRLLDPQYLAAQPSLDAKGRPAVLGNALRAARGLGDPALRASVEAVAAGDPDQGVRHEAREALHKWGIPLARGPRER